MGYLQQVVKKDLGKHSDDKSVCIFTFLNSTNIYLQYVDDV